MDDLERISVGVAYIGGIVSRVVFQSCAGRNVVRGTSGHGGLVEFIDLLLIFGNEPPMNGPWIGLPLLDPEERLLTITKSPEIRMTVFALVRHEEFDMKRLQGRLIEGQRPFDISDGQNHVVEHHFPLTSRALRRGNAAYLDSTTNFLLARPTSSFAEERRQDRLQVRLAAPERVTAFPDDDVRVETMGQFLVEASPLSVHACACEGWCHR